MKEIRTCLKYFKHLRGQKLKRLSCTKIKLVGNGFEFGLVQGWILRNVSVIFGLGLGKIWIDLVMRISRTWVWFPPTWRLPRVMFATKSSTWWHLLDAGYKHSCKNWMLAKTGGREKRPNRSPISQICHQHISSPTNVTNIDVNRFKLGLGWIWDRMVGFWKKAILTKYQLIIISLFSKFLSFWL